MRTLNNKEKLLVSVIGVLLILLVLNVFILGPIHDQTKSYSLEIEQAKSAIRKYMTLERNREQILQSQKQMGGYSSFKGSDEDKSAMVMSKIEEQARKSKLQILDMTPAAATRAKGGVTLYRVHLSAEGQLNNLLDFLAEIEGVNILMQVEKIALTVKDENSGLLKIDAVVLGAVFA